MGRLDDKVIIVTGAAAGFGRGIVLKLTREGAKVLAVDMNEAGLQETIAEASCSNTASPNSCTAFTADISKESSWRSLLQACLEAFGGRLDTVVNCAGVVHNAGPSHEVAEEQFDLMFRVNVKPLYLSNKVITPWFVENKVKGSFVNLSSISEPRPRPFLVWYAASKGAVTVTTKGLAGEYAAQGVRFNCIRPAVGETAMLPKVLGGHDTPEGRKRVLGTVPLGRVCQPEDVANMVCYLASDEANYITGAAFDVDGGRGVS
ncbi:4-formylbenzenesulfonate dehydrogenase TsaC1/TsaC2 [Cyphellophora attinorum]|uniref:4-formylbenzenesulfonate dehydrogenase TsaC1/TsaC2 n=1 Tax=Cyphellophora attinorum TaxID=1664694 RepID=A0A0N1P2Q8_9EURO|nr:4-formylbenzenesulfonate dehydrogenase TsaC1/TsaC2 [Phialophora attinorum]KPI42836.1 4-formylbenzenesulfonate dehydrogenase TsaC1/TsaC2 [Phialophora attinorum]